jgi:predicted XRE-type DNA-binding protein
VTRKPSPHITAAMAAHIRYLLQQKRLFQHQIAALMGCNSGRISEVKTGKLHPGVPAACGPFPV